MKYGKYLKILLVRWRREGSLLKYYLLRESLTIHFHLSLLYVSSWHLLLFSFTVFVVCLPHLNKGWVRVRGFPDGSVGKNPPAKAGDASLIAGSRRSLGEGNSNSLQYSCLWKPMDRGACGAIIHGITRELDTTYWLNNSNKKYYLWHSWW